jgi:hypothetical protein
MKIVVLGLSLSSSWGNGHATTYRALLSAFAARGHEVLFLERDVPWYAAHRDLQPQFCRLALYQQVADLEAWREEIVAADAVIVGSYVPDGIAVGRWVQEIAGGVAVSTTSIRRSRSPAGGRRRRLPVARADPRLRPLPLVHRRAGAAPAGAGLWLAGGAAAVLLGRRRGLSSARPAQALGPQLSGHL